MQSDLLASPATVDPHVMAWRASLTELNCRQLASEHLRGLEDPAAADAYAEYLARGYDRDETKSPSRRRKSKNRSNGKYS